MPYIFETVRDFIEIEPSTLIARFCFTNQDITQIDELALLATEVGNIPRKSIIQRYVSNPVAVSKTLVFEPITVEASGTAEFNTVVVLAGSTIIITYQLGTTVQLSSGLPAIIDLGPLQLFFKDGTETENPETT